MKNDIFQKALKSIQEHSGRSLELQGMILDEFGAPESSKYHQNSKFQMSQKFIKKLIFEPPGHPKIIKFSMLTHVLGGLRGRGAD